MFNYDLPRDKDDYVHRIGRTGRAGKQGNAASLVTAEDFKVVQDIAKITGDEPVWLGEAPTEADLEDGARRRGRPGRSAGGRTRGRGGRTAATQGRPPRNKNSEETSAVEADARATTRGDSQPAAEAAKRPPRKRSRRGGSRKGVEATAEAGVATSTEQPTGKRPEKVATEGSGDVGRGSGRRRGRASENVDRAPAQGFADNIPEFLRKPVRRQKVTS